MKGRVDDESNEGLVISFDGVRTPVSTNLKTAYILLVRLGFDAFLELDTLRYTTSSGPVKVITSKSAGCYTSREFVEVGLIIR